MLIYLFPYIQELLDDKRNGTLAYLKSQNIIEFYNGKLGLNLKKKVKRWGEFLED